MSTSEKPRFVIIDGNAIVHRAYHALPPLTAKDGTVVNAVYGFALMLLKILSDIKPTYLAVTFDMPGGTFRDEIYEDYKATRVKSDQDLYDQIPLAHDLVEAFNIPIYEQKGFEADDVIGTLAKKVKKNKEDIEFVIVTGDKDLLQLVDEDTHVYLLKRGVSEFELYDEQKVIEKFTFGPNMVVTYKSIKGDSSDNIPGVKGIGDKGATKLINEIGGLEEIYKQLKDKDSRLHTEFKKGIIEKLEASEDNAFMSQELATIHTEVKELKFTLAKCVAHEFDVKKVTDLFRSFGFYSLVKRIPGVEQSEHSGNKKTKARSKKITIVNEKNSAVFFQELNAEKEWGCKEVLSGTSVFESDLLGFVFVTYKNSYYVEVKKISKKDNDTLFSLFTNEKKTIVGHNLKQLVRALLWNNKNIAAKIFDVMVASYIIDASTRAHNLKDIVLRELGETMVDGGDQTSLFGVDPTLIAGELQRVLEIKKKQEKSLKEAENLKLFEDMEMALIPALAQAELHGIALDTKALKEQSTQIAKDLKDITQKIWKESGEEFNVASSMQLREVLFEKMELPTEGIKKGKTGYSTAASELEKLRDQHEIIAMIESFRELSKLQNTYVDVLPTLINKKTGRIHTTFNQTVASTGRLSSSDPNLQNIPIRTTQGKKVRDAFVAEEGYILIAADYSQMELRIVASMAEDKNMMAIFQNGEDIHKATAAFIHGVKLEDVTKDQRRSAKEVNFGVLYGMGAFGLAQRTKLSQAVAREFIKKYFESFSRVKKFLDDTLEKAKETGYVETLFGRRRYVPELQAGNFQVRASGERMAINMPIQGTLADITKIAMINMHKHIKKTYKKEDVKILLQVHDELVLEVKKGLEESVAKELHDIMVAVVELKVPVVVEYEIGKSWGNLK
ncbi:MAG: DNA polymerase I [Candidatus Magasanikbacteria bacterium]|nr:DNA polymerase I [Candidatus Magasanikbacteria bacterium]